MNTRVDARVVANVGGRTDVRKTGSLYCAMPEAGVTITKKKKIHKNWALFGS